MQFHLMQTGVVGRRHEIEAGMAGTGAASGGGEDDVRPKLPHAPSNTVSAQAAPRLAIVRALSDLTMASPALDWWPHLSRSQA